MPYDNVTKKHYDSGDYQKASCTARDKIGLTAWRERQARGEPDGRRIGIGFASYCEQSAHGASVFAGWGLPIVPGYDAGDGAGDRRRRARGACRRALARPGNGDDARAGRPRDARHRHRARFASSSATPANTPYSTGTYASRSIVMAGGAVANACKALIPRFIIIGAHVMQAADRHGANTRTGSIAGPQRAIPLREVAETWYLRPHQLPPDVDLGGLEATFALQAQASTPARSAMRRMPPWSRSTPRLGDVEILDYVIVEDCGTLVNPMVVDGQTLGGAAQGIGTAMYEESPYDQTASRSPRPSPTICCPDRPRSRRSASSTCRPRRPTPSSASRAWAKAARSRRRR